MDWQTDWCTYIKSTTIVTNMLNLLPADLTIYQIYTYVSHIIFPATRVFLWECTFLFWIRSAVSSKPISFPSFPITIIQWAIFFPSVCTFSWIKEIQFSCEVASLNSTLIFQCQVWIYKCCEFVLFFWQFQLYTSRQLN